ncbi:MAG: efflux RND transporter permease subunit [Fibrobacterota bacterium]|nr:MAG: efflux RND transporter permease subunit [Fibrobacterota bacterium]
MLTVFLALGGVWALRTIPLDAIPDLSDPQVIVQTTWEGTSPQVVEDQVTQPLSRRLTSTPGAQVVRGYSFFGQSLVYVIFEDGTDLYWARSRVQEMLSGMGGTLPAGVVPSLGPDASGVGWVYEYGLVSDSVDNKRLRQAQDWIVKPALQTLPGVSEVASVGGLVRQFQVTVDPVLLRGAGLKLSDVESALRQASADAGGEAIEVAETEWMVRTRGSVRTLNDLRDIPLQAGAGAGEATAGAMGGSMAGAPTAQAKPASRMLRLSEVATLTEGPAMRRGLTDLDGQGDVVAGIVVMRYGKNALATIEAVKAKFEELQPGLPPGTRIVPLYDRSHLIQAAVGHLGWKLLEEMLIVALVCGLFLFHARSALIAVFTLPVALLAAFLVMRLQGIGADLMSLGGMAIAIGAMVDAAIILVENAHKHLEHEQEKPPDQRSEHWSVILRSALEVGPSLFWSLLLITVSFLPVFALQAQEGRLFHPLAYTKTYAMAAAAALSVTLVPVLMGMFLTGRIPSESANPVNRLLVRIYHPLVAGVLAHPRKVLAAALVVLASTVYPLSRLGSEFMPPLFEGDLLYMPTVLPGISVTKSRELLQQTDRMIRTVPEVEQVFGKSGRAETATDPAGFDMFETVIRLKDKSQWRPGVQVEDIVRELDAAVKVPGLTNAWTLPIKSRIDMLSTGIRTPIGIKISGSDPDSLQAIATRVEAFLAQQHGVSSAFAERAVGGYYLDIEIDRAKAASRGVSVARINDVVRTGLAGMPVATAYDGLERIPITLRYSRETRDNREAIEDLPVDGAWGPVRLADVAATRWTLGPMMVRSESGSPNVFVFLDTRETDLGGFVRKLSPRLAASVPIPTGYGLAWSGQWEGMERVKNRMMVVVPFTLLLIVLILYLNTKSFMRTAIVMLAVPFSLVGAFWFLHLAGFQMSVAVWVGLIALAGLDAETGVVMLLYLDQAWKKVREKVAHPTLSDLVHAIDEGAVRRVRPKIMTASVILAGLFPILWSDGAGSDVMKRIAAPMVGGVITSVAMELLVYPAIFLLWQRHLVNGKANQ